MKRNRFLIYAIFPIFLSISISYAQTTSVIDSLKQILQITTEDSIKVLLYDELSWNYAITRTKLDSAKLYADSLRLISIKSKNQAALIKSSFCYGVISRFKGEYHEGLKHLEKFVDYHKIEGDSLIMASGLYQTAVIHKDLGNYKKSLAAYYRILNIYKEDKYLNGIGFTLHSIAHIQRILRMHSEAIENYKESIKIKEQIGDKLGLSMSLESLGNTLGEIKEFKESQIYLNQALKTSEEENDLDGIASISENLGNVFQVMGEYDTALTYHLKSLSIRENLPSKNNLALSLNQVGNSYAKLEEHNQARKYLRMAQEIAMVIGARPILVNIYKNQMEIAKAERNIDQAFKYHELYTDIKDSISSIEKNKQLVELETKYQTAQKDQEINLLTKENEVQQANVQRQRTFQNALIGGILLLTIIAGLIFYTFRSRLKNQKLLATKNEEIKTAQLREQLGTLEMKALRAQMNPHFLFNCMNSINRMIMAEENDRASKYLSKFSKLVRLMLENSEQPKVSLQDELLMLESYIQLEAIRFKNKLDYIIKVEEEIDKESTYLPPMVLQPFVENAIWHGLMHKKGQGHLTIGIKEMQDELQCTITDNGIGREKSLKLQTQNGHHKKSMGIKITADRLKLLTKQKIQKAIEIIDLKDNENNAIGTQVNVSIPIT